MAAANIENDKYFLCQTRDLIDDTALFCDECVKTTVNQNVPTINMTATALIASFTVTTEESLSNDPTDDLLSDIIVSNRSANDMVSDVAISNHTA
ncbi:unnamed protein product [Adineta steineri]|uniref:Uncharacterized protein n=1 Tax=Adineta steineri TaxID=433720 RepID=A0A818I1W2_9BILA|nr:unnamed protein product [Adineta steineri]CAF3518443.1 unnamed protein product [Adineta steineri]